MLIIADLLLYLCDPMVSVISLPVCISEVQKNIWSIRSPRIFPDLGITGRSHALGITAVLILGWPCLESHLMNTSCVTVLLNTFFNLSICELFCRQNPWNQCPWLLCASRRSVNVNTPTLPSTTFRVHSTSSAQTRDLAVTMGTSCPGTARRKGNFRFWLL